MKGFSKATPQTSVILFCNVREKQDLKRTKLCLRGTKITQHKLFVVIRIIPDSSVVVLVTVDNIAIV